MADRPDTERIAREAVALCADLLRQFHIRGENPGENPSMTARMAADHVFGLTRRVLAWQEALDDTTLRQ